MWDAGVLGFVVEILVELEKNMDLEIVYDHRSQSEYWLHHLIQFKP